MSLHTLQGIERFFLCENKTPSSPSPTLHFIFHMPFRRSRVAISTFPDSVAKACGKTQQYIPGFRQAYLSYFLLYQNVKER